EARFCNSLVVQSGKSIDIRTSLTIDNFFNNSGALLFTSSTGELHVGTHMRFYSGSSLSISTGLDPDIYINGGLYFYNGSNVNVTRGKIFMSGSSTQYIYTWDDNTSINNLYINSTNCTHYFDSSNDWTINGSLFVWAQKNYIGNADVTTVIKGNIHCYTSCNMQFNTGKVSLQGSTNTYVNTYPGNYFHDLEINKTAGNYAYLQSDTDIRNDVSIISGSLHAETYDLHVGGYWTNNVGPNGFEQEFPSDSSVIFEGTANFSFITTDEYFNRMVINKPSWSVYIPSGVQVECYRYSFQTGLLIVIGSLTVDVVDDDAIYGDYVIEGNVVLHQSTIRSVNIMGNIEMDGGSFDVYGGTNPSSFVNNGSLAIYLGTMDFHDVGIYVPSSFTMTMDGGLLRTSKDFSVYNLDFLPTGGAIELYGNVDSNIYLNDPVNKLIITKDEGKIVYLSTSIHLSDSLLIRSGTLLVDNKNLSAAKGVVVEGRLVLSNDARLDVFPTYAITIQNGGRFDSWGNDTDYATVTRIGDSGSYTFVVKSGGIISSHMTIFEYMGPDGINVQSDGLVDPAFCFNRCLFRNGAVQNTLLTINNNQDLCIYNAKFPHNLWSGYYNISKTENQGHISLYCYEDDFSGPAYEQDPYNLIDWYPTTIPPVENVNIVYDDFYDMAHLTWDYSIGYSDFIVWSSINPEGPYEFLTSVSVTEAHVSAGPQRSFFKVSAFIP
ncbi:MAG: hypothetical protein JW973_10840, partial [Bacteroidales bacterium]|nr:hypothetical protein [Bacteroidales bacterium]